MTNQKIEPIRFEVVHPLHDTPELKCSVDELGLMPLSPSARIALLSLRGYLLLMAGLLGYHMLEMAHFVK